jgi:hypothetical protein
MAEPIRPGSPDAEVAERDVLLATKLHIPGRVRSFCPALGCWSGWGTARHAS